MCIRDSLIGSSVERGYFLIRTQKDFEDAVKTYEVKIRGLARTVKQLKKNLEERLKTQLELPLFFKRLEEENYEQGRLL